MSQLAKDFINCNAQLIKVTSNGAILSSDNGIIDISNNTNISDLNPFFESVVFMLPEIESEESFVCVNLEIHGNSGIFDITIKKIEKSEELVIILQDFTEHYNAFQKVAQRRNESVINLEIIDLQNKQFAAEKEFKNRFLANVSHEIRTPLNGILGFLTLLEKSGINEEQKGLVNIIQRSGTHLNGLIEDLLDISKIEVGQLSIVRKKFKLADVAKYIKKLYEVKAKEKGLDFSLILSDTLPTTIIGDRTRLQQILINLLDNAFKFTHEGSVSLEIATNSRRGKNVNLNFKVGDTGIGIAEEDLDNVFESFVQLNSSTTYGGTGLGLSITKHIIEFLKGRISVKSELGKGTTFSLSLPYELELTKEKVSKKPATTSGSKLDASKKYQILMVEDSEINQMLLMKLLVTRGNYYIDLATNGQEALDFVNSETQYDLILMDIKLPKLNGVEVAKQIKASDDFQIKRIPIIAVSASASKKDKLACKDAGMNDFIAIPFEQDELFKKIEKHIK
jgi:signal transduction histidine kinase/CheY-like chemotaxis protein